MLNSGTSCAAVQHSFLNSGFALINSAQNIAFTIEETARFSLLLLCQIDPSWYPLTIENCLTLQRALMIQTPHVSSLVPSLWHRHIRLSGRPHDTSCRIPHLLFISLQRHLYTCVHLYAPSLTSCEIKIKAETTRLVLSLLND